MDRLHISFFGPANSGKSTLVNAIAGQEVSLVSSVPGTTTDAVRKLIELPGLGPCVLIDTAGLDDSGILGSERERLTRAVIDETDVAVVLLPPQEELDGLEELDVRNGLDMPEAQDGPDTQEVRLTVRNSDRQPQKPYDNEVNGQNSGPLAAAGAVISEDSTSAGAVFSGCAHAAGSVFSGKAPAAGPFLSEDVPATGSVFPEGTPAGVIDGFIKELEAAGIPYIVYRRGESVDSLLERIAAVAPEHEEPWLTGSLVKPGDCVLLVMPQDSEAPKGRLILPQVQVLRELLDRGCTPLCCTPDSLQAALDRTKPDLVITDSQVFGLVNAAIPPEMPLTSFSVLLAGAKGDLKTFVEGARAIDRLRPGDRVLIAEACTHVPNTEDIGRVKIPALLRKQIASQHPSSYHSEALHCHPEAIHCHPEALHCHPEALLCHPEAIHCHPERSEGSVSDGSSAGWPTFSEAQGLQETSPSGAGYAGSAPSLRIDIAAGNDFPEDLSPYSLIIHCGACVATATLVRSRIRKARLAGVPITNYGIALAALQGILSRISLP